MLCALAFGFASCESDDNDSYDNYITISGSITINGKTYSNPTFNLGTSSEIQGFLYQMEIGKNQTSYIDISPKAGTVSAIDDLNIHYYLVLEGDQPGNAGLTAMILFNKGDENVFTLESVQVQATITKIEEVGGFIEATYSGSFMDHNTSSQSYSAQGKIKAKRIQEPIY